MLKKDGGKQLLDFTERTYQETVTEVTPGIWHVLGIGHSNAIFIEGNTSVILIDTLDTLERGMRLSEIIRDKTGKPVKTIFYTHGHPDHRGGAGAFSKSAPEIIAFAPKQLPLGRGSMLAGIQDVRGSRQFGYTLNDEENISQGIGIREGLAYGEVRAIVPPTTVYQEDQVSREIDGVQLQMVRLPGETADQIMIWIPDREILCCGDNYYGCWPNLYAIRGGEYRDIEEWLRSLDTLMSYDAQYLLPGHTAVLAGKDPIRDVLSHFRGAIDYVFQQTLLGMNEGKSADELAVSIHLPEEYASLPYLGEYYGCIEWTVRAVYTAYLGWFDGNPTHLHPLAPDQHAVKTVALMGGADAVHHAAKKAVDDGEYQWCLELCDLLLICEGNTAMTAQIRGLKAQALKKLAEYETSANGRHYYLTCAHELIGDNRID